ncbi:MAG: hypothetical protein ACI9KM_001828, partial [Rubritalea sp.]
FLDGKWTTLHAVFYYLPSDMITKLRIKIKSGGRPIAYL